MEPPPADMPLPEMPLPVGLEPPALEIPLGIPIPIPDGKGAGTWGEIGSLEAIWPPVIVPVECDDVSAQVAGMEADVSAAQAQRVVALTEAAAMGGGWGCAGQKELAGALAEFIAPIGKKMGELAAAMATGMIMTFFAGIMSMPWILDGRHDKLCKFNIVERKDWCNKERDKALEKCPVSDPVTAKVCISQIQMVTDPGTMSSFIAVGMPPFTNPPCLLQGKCEKKSADQIMLGIIIGFKEAIKDMVKATTKIAKAMAGLGSICAKAAGAPGSPAGTCAAGRIQYQGGLINARHAHVEMANAMLKLALFQQAEAKKCGDPDLIWAAYERRLKAEEHLWDAKQDTMMAKVEMGVAKATAEKMGALLETGEGDRSSAPRPKDAWDEHITFDSDGGTNREFKCPKSDLFGCGCAEVEGCVGEREGGGGQRDRGREIEGETEIETETERDRDRDRHRNIEIRHRDTNTETYRHTNQGVRRERKIERESQRGAPERRHKKQRSVP
jgi:hypothetical protein